MYALPHLTLSSSEPALPRHAASEPSRSGSSVGSERELIERARSGDSDARAKLCQIHQGPLFALFIHLVGHRQDAEDLTQEALVRALRSLHQFRGDAGFGTWLRRIAVHLVHDRARKRGRRARLLPLEQADHAEQPGEGLTERLKRRELEEHLKKLVLELAPHLRVPLVLRLEEKRTYEEIAEMTGVKPATCRTQIMKAREQLRKGLADYGQENL